MWKNIEATVRTDLAVAFEDSLSTSDTVADEPLSGETRPTIQCSCECSLLASHRDPFTFRATLADLRSETGK